MITNTCQTCNRTTNNTATFIASVIPTTHYIKVPLYPNKLLETTSIATCRPQRPQPNFTIGKILIIFCKWRYQAFSKTVHLQYHLNNTPTLWGKTRSNMTETWIIPTCKDKSIPTSDKLSKQVKASASQQRPIASVRKNHIVYQLLVNYSPFSAITASKTLRKRYTPTIRGSRIRHFALQPKAANYSSTAHDHLHPTRFV